LQCFLGNLTSDQILVYGQEKDMFFQDEMANTAAIAGIHELLRELSQANLPMAVASCGGRARVHQTLDLLQINRHFRAVITGDDVTRGKPDAEIYHKTAALLGVRPADSLVFEDSISGILAATAAGMQSVGITDPQHARSLLEAGAVETLPDFTGVSFERVRQLFSLKSKKNQAGNVRS
jgi:HAD superfamily hydrolase (TIGR01509 family)